MTTENRKTAVFYGRVSGVSQTADDKDGFRRQKDAVQIFAEKSGMTIVGEYFEKAVSGTKGVDERPAFQEMLIYLLGNGCRTIIVESLDRLAREYRIQETILIYLSSKGLSLIAANTGEDITRAITDDPMKKALIQIQGIFHELDKSQLVLKLRKSREAKRSRGERCEGKKPFGFYSGEEETLKRLRQLHRKPRGGPRRSLSQIARILNTEGLPTRSAKKWSRGSVWGIVRKTR